MTMATSQMTKENRTTEGHILAREGWWIIAGSFGLSLALSFFSSFLGLLGGLWALFCVYFFRNPKRVIPDESQGVICPADGTIIQISTEVEPDFINEARQRVTIFMSPFNVHVNRMPVTGSIEGEIYHQGEFLAAFDKNASSKNERHAALVKTENGDQIVFVQIAGWFARRIVNYLKKGDQMVRGSIFGVILFGSRMDVYLPASYQVQVSLKQKVKAGETILARKG